MTDNFFFHRNFLVSNTGPVVSPDASRVLRQVFPRLCQREMGRQYTGEGESRKRRARIIELYHKIQCMVRSSPKLRRETTLALLDVNQHTLSMWYVKHR